MLDPARAPQLRRIAVVSCHLNGEGRGALVAASRRAANAQV